MHHIFHEGKDPNKPTLLLLHGTGGTEKKVAGLSVRITILPLQQPN